MSIAPTYGWQSENHVPASLNGRSLSLKPLGHLARMILRICMCSASIAAWLESRIQDGALSACDGAVSCSPHLDS